MINNSDFCARLLKTGMSVGEFARQTGRTAAKVKKYCSKGVPVKESKYVGEALDEFAKQIDVEEYINDQSTQ